MRKLLSLALIGSSLSACYDIEPKQDLPEERPVSSMTGVLYDAAVENAAVSVYLLDPETRKKGSLISTVGLTDKLGNYNVDVTYPSKTGFAITEANGSDAFYIEEASGTRVALDKEHFLKALSTYEYSPDATDHTVVVSTFSTLASAFIECSIEDGLTLGESVTSGNTEFGTIFGANLLTTLPSNPTHETYRGVKELDDSLTIGFWAAAISQWTYDEAIRQDRTPHTMGLTSIDLIMSFYRDIRTDCNWDGSYIDDNGISQSLYFGNKEINRDVLTREIPLALLRFLSTDKNLTDIKTDNLIHSVNAVAESTSSVFGDSAPTPLDSDGAQITLNYVNGDFVHGDVKVKATLDSNVGVRSHQWLVNGIQAQGDLDSISFSTLAYENIEVCLNVTDMLYTTTKACRSLVASNEHGYFINNNAAQVYKTDTFDLSITAKNLPQGIDYAVVDGVSAHITNLDNDGEFALVFSDLTLEQGLNKKSLLLVDSIGVEHNATFTNIKRDVWKPQFELISPSNLSTLVVETTNKGKENFTKFISTVSEPQTLLINSSIVKLNGASADPENLTDLNWPHIQFNVFDNVNDEHETVFTNTKDINVTWSLYLLDENGKKLHIVEPTDSLYKNDDQSLLVIPFATEYFGADWWTNEDQLYIDLVASDEAGNTTKETISFVVKNANPTITNPLSNTAYYNNSVTWDFDVSGFGGVTEMEYLLNGEVVKTEIDFRNPSLEFLNFEEGIHTLTINVLLESGETKSWDMLVNIDSTAPVIVHNAKPLYTHKNVDIEGATTNEVFALESISACEKSGVIKGNEFSFALDTDPRENGLVDCVIKGVDNAENTFSKPLIYNVDSGNPIINVTNSLVVDYIDNQNVIETGIFQLNADETIYIPKSRRFLANAQLNDIESLKAARIPYIILSKSDLDIANSYKSDDSNVVGTWAYYHDDQLKHENSFTANSQVIALVDEVLGADWADLSDLVTHKLIVNLKDESGRESSETITFKIKTLDLTVNNRTTSTTDFFNEGATFNLDVSGFEGADRVEFFVDGVLYTTAIDPENPVVSFTGLSDSAHTLTIKAYSGDRLVGSDVMSLSYDSTNPSFTITSKSLFDSQRVNLNGTYTDNLAGVTSVSVCNQEAVLSNGGWSIDLNNAPQANGRITCDLIIKDNANNIVTDTTNYNVDLHAPVITESKSASIDYIKNGVIESRTFALNTNDTIYAPMARRFLGNIQRNDLASLQAERIPYLSFAKSDSVIENNYTSAAENVSGVWSYYHDDLLKASNTFTGNLEVIPLVNEVLGADWADLSDSVVHKIEVLLTDEVGHSTTNTYTFKLKSVDPVFENPLTDNSYFKLDAEHSFNVTGFEGVDRVEFFVDGVSYAVSEDPQAPKLLFKDLTEDKHELIVKTYRDNTELTSNEMTFTFDITKPVVGVTGDNIFASKSARLSGYQSDGLSGVASVSVCNTNATLSNDDDTWTVLLDENQDENGKVICNVKATDKAGNETVLNTEYFIDLVDPAISTTHSASAQYINSSGVVMTEPMTLNSTKTIYVPKARRFLGDTSSTDTNGLTVDNIPYISFEKADGTAPFSYSTEQSKLSGTWEYYHNDLLKVAANFDSNSIVIPLVDDVLGSDWADLSDLVTHKIMVNVKDESGREVTKSFTFRTKTVDLTISNTPSSTDYFGNNQTLVFDANGFEGADRVEFFVDGVQHSIAIDPTNPTLDFTGLSNGSHSLIVKAYKDGVELAALPMAFSYDTVKPSFNVTSSLVSQSPTIDLSGTALDSGSGVNNISICGTAASINGNSWSKTITNNPNSAGRSDCIVSVEDKAGNELSTTLSYFVDTVDPVVTIPSVPTVDYLYYEDLTKTSEAFNVTSGITTPVYVDYGRVSLSTLKSSFEAKSKTNKVAQLNASKNLWIELLKSDPIAANSISSTQSEMVGAWAYYHNSSLVAQGDISDNGFILPLTTEYLGADWYRTDSKTTHKIIATVTDRSGRTSSKSFTWRINYVETGDALTVTKSNVNLINGISFTNRSKVDDILRNAFTYTIKNNRSYPVTVYIDGAGSYSVKSTAYNARKENKYRTATSYLYQTTGGYIETTSTTNQYGSLVTTSTQHCGLTSKWSSTINNKNFYNHHSYTAPVTYGTYTVKYNVTPTSDETIENYDNVDLFAETGVPRIIDTQTSNRTVTSVSVQDNDGNFIGVNEEKWESDTLKASCTGGTLTRKTVTNYETAAGWPKNILTSGANTTKNSDSDNIIHSGLNKNNTAIVIPANSTITITKQVKTPTAHNYGDTCNYNYISSTCDASLSWTNSPNLNINVHASPIVGSNSDMFKFSDNYSSGGVSYTLSR